MGNFMNKTLDRWGVNPRKRKTKRKRQGDPDETQDQVPDVHIYDDVPDERPQRPGSKTTRHDTEEDRILYADLQLSSHPTTTGVRKFPPSDEQHTEYASVNFIPRGEKLTQKLNSLQRQFSSSSAKLSSLPADILIPPGALKTPKRRQSTPSGATQTYQHKPVMV